MNWVYLVIAIVSEVIATSSLKASHGFSRAIPSVMVIVGYASAFFLLSLAVRTIPIGVAYAVWAGVGVVLMCVVGRVFFGQSLDPPAIFAICLIGAGIVVLNGFSKSLPR